jgi:uncharacterized protein (TIGR00251 family)
LGEIAVENIDGDVVIRVKVVPGASRTGAAGVIGDMLKIKISAPAEKGKANKCLLEFLAKQVGVKRNAISLIAGRTSPVKRVQISGVSAKKLLDKLKL